VALLAKMPLLALERLSGAGVDGWRACAATGSCSTVLSPVAAAGPGTAAACWTGELVIQQPALPGSPSAPPGLAYSLAVPKHVSDIFQASGLLLFKVLRPSGCLNFWVMFVTCVYHRVYTTGSRSSDTPQLALWQKIDHSFGASSDLFTGADLICQVPAAVWALHSKTEKYTCQDAIHLLGEIPVRNCLLHHQTPAN